MLNLLSLLIGLGSLVLALIAFTPLLGWANWVIIPMAIVGLALGAMSSHSSGQNLNIVVIAVGVIRLMLGGGIF
jgi:hypothetical protein